MEIIRDEVSAASKTELQDENLEVPQWVAPVLNKMKAEMCAEITARVAYSVRLMLDKNLEDVKELLTGTLDSTFRQGSEHASVLICHDCVKKKLKREERDEKKRENQVLKEEKRAKKTEKLIKKMEKSYKHKMGSLVANMQQELCGEMQAVGLEERKKSVNFDDGEEKTANVRPKLDLPVIGYAYADEGNSFLEKDVLPSSCDSEFEVVSLPSQTAEFHFVQGNTDDSLLASSEDEVYENAVEENAATSTMTESTTSVATVKNLHEEEQGAVLQDGEQVAKTEGLQLERSRTPYRQNSGEVTVVDMVEDVGHEDPFIQDPASAPEPEEEPAAAASPAIPLERDRAPYASAGSSADYCRVSRGPRGGAPDIPHVDILPENLWKGAVSVAAQAYNAAKSVVGDLGGVRGQGHVSAQPPPRDPREELLKQLQAMGFQNRSRNIQLLERYKNNMDEVVEALLA